MEAIKGELHKIIAKQIRYCQKCPAIKVDCSECAEVQMVVREFVGMAKYVIHETPLLPNDIENVLRERFEELNKRG